MLQRRADEVQISELGMSQQLYVVIYFMHGANHVNCRVAWSHSGLVAFGVLQAE